MRRIIIILLVVLCGAVVTLVGEKEQQPEPSLRALYIIGERWEAHRLAPFNWREDGTYPQIYVYVIGTADGEEIFTIQKPGTEREWRKPPTEEAK